MDDRCGENLIASVLIVTSMKITILKTVQLKTSDVPNALKTAINGQSVGVKIKNAKGQRNRVWKKLCPREGYTEVWRSCHWYRLRGGER